MASDPATSRTQIKENLKNLAKGGVASVVEHGGTVLSSEQAGHSKDKAKEYAHNVKHYGAFAEDYLGFDDPNKDLRKAVKAKEKAAKKARKAKKKAGKGKKGEDLFDPANLAKYKKGPSHMTSTLMWRGSKTDTILSIFITGLDKKYYY